MEFSKKIWHKVAGVTASMMMVSAVFAVVSASADESSILLVDETVTAHSSPELREVAAQEIVQKINERAGRTVINIKPNAEADSALIVIDNDYNLGENGESLSEITDVLSQYGFDRLEAIA